MKPGLFDSDVLGTPRERQEKVLRTALEFRREQWTHQTFFKGAGDLLLQHGKFYPARPLPPEFMHLKGPMGRCFENALDAVAADPTLRYCEGVYTVGQGHYTPHAWALAPDDQMLELTYPTPSDPNFELGREYLTGLPILPQEHWGYWGVVIDADYARTLSDLQEGVGVLDRPAQDAREGHSEWREVWDVLSAPYDVSRKEPYLVTPCPACGDAHIEAYGCRTCETGFWEPGERGSPVAECPRCAHTMEPNEPHCTGCGWVRGEEP